MGFTIIAILIVLVCIVLVLSVLVQNPKGGGLSASFGGMGNQVMGARKATDFIEKTTWVLATTLLVLSLISGSMLPNKDSLGTDAVDERLRVQEPVPTMEQPAQQPAAPAQGPAEPPQ